MSYYRKKPVVIEAVQYLGGGNMVNNEAPDWLWDALRSGVVRSTNGTDPFVITTLEGEHIASPGDWIIRDIKGELYPCNPDIFEATYEKV